MRRDDRGAMSNKGIIVVVLIFVVAAGAAAALVPLGHSLSLLERYRVESAVKATLNDPESALFTNYRIARGQDRVKVCGYVNAKNARGGYVGSRLFYGVLRDGQFSLKRYRHR